MQIIFPIITKRGFYVKSPVVLTNAAQSFSFAEKLQGRTNIGAAAAADQTALTVAGNSSSTFNLSQPYPSLILYNYQSSAFAMALYQGN